MSITIITPVFNSSGTIRDCLRSIASQSVACQHIIVDGGSTDGTIELVKEETAPGREWSTEPDQGMYDAINKGLSRAAGDIVGVLNADDFYNKSNVLEKVVNAFSEPQIDAVYGDLLYVDRKDTSKVVRNWRSGDYRPERFYSGWMPPHPTFFLRRAIYQRYGSYRLDLGSAADYELMLRVLLKNRIRAKYIPQVMVRMRNDGVSNASLKNRINAHRNDRKAWRVNQIQPRPWTLFAKPVSKLGQWL
ncbi:MAG: glycosyltransferase family 2 protein [Pseudomonadota bacterium]